jgi:transcriptional regulator with XRE-family HTH domain
MTLKEARFKKGKTQIRPAILSGIHQSKISLIENGFLVPRDDEKRRLAKALGMKPEPIEWPQRYVGLDSTADEPSQTQAG